MNKLSIKTDLIFLISIVLIYLNSGCKETKRGKEITPKNDIELLAIKSDTTFAFFWTNFQKAVVNNDFQKLTKLTNFPIETRGPQDIDKIVKYNESEFNTVFQTFLKQDYEPDLTELDLIKKLEKFELTNEKDFTLDEDFARVGEMVFKKIEGQWKLKFIYLYYGTMDEIKKKLNKI